MRIYKEFSLEDFKTREGATKTKDKIIKEGKVKAFELLLNELYPEGLDEYSLNDLLWFGKNWIFEALGISEEEEEV